MAHHDAIPSSVVILAFVIGTAIGIAIARYRTHLFQNRGEAKVTRALRMFQPPDYHLLNHVTLPLENGSTQVDHVLISRFGIFVIETKDYGGWLFGSEGDRYWIQMFYGNKFRFQNPLRQNHGHVRAIRKLLDFLPYDAVRSVVVLTGNAKFKTATPPKVFTLKEFIEHVQGQTTEVMSINRVQFCVGRLETTRLSISKQTDVEHIQRVRRRHGIDS
jgi:hypothetical protein